jgi:hypothetical protein
MVKKGWLEGAAPTPGRRLPRLLYEIIKVAVLGTGDEFAKF